VAEAVERVAAIIVNYNMPERADALAEYIRKYVEWPVEVFLVDNGSDLVPPAKNTTLWLEMNIQTTGGWLAGLEQARDDAPFLGYWFLITSTEFTDGDPLTPMARLLVEDENAVGIHPALTVDSTTAWMHLITRPTPNPSLKGGEPRRTWMMDNIASLWRAEWFDQVGGFDPKLVYGWGIDLELSYLARAEGWSLWVHENCQVKKVTDIGYTMGRMNMSADERTRLAGENMGEVLRGRYGDNWAWKMWEEFVTDEMV
jgi:hypothetical protein